MKRKSNTIIPWKRRGAWNGTRVVEIWLDERWSPPHPDISITPAYDRYHYFEITSIEVKSNFYNSPVGCRVRF
jgi:hypothetical protein